MKCSKLSVALLLVIACSSLSPAALANSQAQGLGKSHGESSLFDTKRVKEESVTGKIEQVISIIPATTGFIVNLPEPASMSIMGLILLLLGSLGRKSVRGT